MRQTFYNQSPESVLEYLESQGERCYDCGHNNWQIVCRRGQCVKGCNGYPHETRATCEHWIKANDRNNT